MIYVGVDLGKEGGIAALDGDGAKRLWCEPMPLTGKQYDIQGVLNMLRRFEPAETHVAYESLHVMPGSMGGSKANFSRGYALAMIETALAALRLPSTPVRAQAWQKVMFAGMKVTKGETKAAALTVARRLWPNESWVIGKRVKPMDGLVDAALIAEWLRRELH